MKFDRLRKRAMGPSSLAWVIACVSIAPALVLGADRSVGRNHWAFRPIVRPRVPTAKQSQLEQTPIDAFILASLERKNLSMGTPADRATLLRRLTFDLVGLPPAPGEIEAFVASRDPDAYGRVVERLLSNPHYGERWGKYWLDVAGYADSNGYFNADSDRPFAYRYRDYVIRAVNADTPFDQFVREQLAGDELAGNVAGKPPSPRTVELFAATHFLRNAQDGTSESDGNPDERRVDRATALQGALQITMNGLLGVTIQCCRCHEHKFEPIEHAEYYRLQSIFYPAFPAYEPARWVTPKARIREMATASEHEQWASRDREIESQKTAARRSFAAWVAANRPAESILFRDDFDRPGELKRRWSGAGMGDQDHHRSGPAQLVALDTATAPGALVEGGSLKIIESGAAGDRRIVTKKTFDWKPTGDGEWIQASFDLVSNRTGGGAPAERIAFFIAAHDSKLAGSVPGAGPTGGNVLIDGIPAGGASVHVGYPGPSSKSVGQIGKTGYEPGHRYGVRVTSVGGGKYRLQQIVDYVTEQESVTLSAADLPNGRFGFEYCCGRSFVVDNVLVETSSGKGEKSSEAAPPYRQAYRRQEKKLGKLLAGLEAARKAKPGSLACVTDIVSNPSPLHVLKRGNYSDLGEVVVPSGLTVLCDGPPALSVTAPYSGSQSTGRRLAFARWLTRPNTRASALLARVMVNRIWQRHFGRGIVTTPDNLGVSGSAPSHPELLEYLADEFVRSGWSVKAMHRLILLSAVYRQSSSPRDTALAADPDDRLLWRYPMQRLDAEAVRDAMLAVAGELSERLYGPYVPTNREEDGNVVVAETQEGHNRRSVYLQQRRTQVNTLLELFDAPVMVNNCAVRGTSTVPLQSLALLNSAFVRARAAALAETVRLHGSRPPQSAADVDRTLAIVFGRRPTRVEAETSRQFLKQQTEIYRKSADADRRAWRDLSQMLLASNAFLYVE